MTITATSSVVLLASTRSFSILRLSSPIRRSLFISTRTARVTSCPVSNLRCFSSSQSFRSLPNVTEPLDLGKVLDLSQPIGTMESPVLEPAFHTLGLGHAYPSGWLQTVMENMHLHLEVPWWATIVITTFALRILIFPIVIKAQRNMIKLNNNLPEMQQHQVDMLKATSEKDRNEAQMKFFAFMAEKDINPLRNYIPIMGTGAVFCSMFFALRGMAACPVESMKTEGALWFMDLTVQDPLYLLPLITATSVYVHLKLGADGIDTNSLPPFFRKFVLALPLLSLPIMCQFPTALNLYWFTTNIISIVQSRVIKLPALRQKLGLGEMVSWKSEDLPMNRATLVNPFSKEALQKRRNLLEQEKLEKSSVDNSKKVDLEDVQERIQKSREKEAEK